MAADDFCLIIESIVGVAVILTRRLDRLVLVLECLTLSVIRRSHQVAVVFDRSRLCDTPLHHLGTEVITIT